MQRAFVSLIREVLVLPDVLHNSGLCSWSEQDRCVPRLRNRPLTSWEYVFRLDLQYGIQFPLSAVLLYLQHTFQLSSVSLALGMSPSPPSP